MWRLFLRIPLRSERGAGSCEDVCSIGQIPRETPCLTQAPPAVLKELEAVKSLTETSSASPPGLDTAFWRTSVATGVSEGLEIV